MFNPKKKKSIEMASLSKPSFFAPLTLINNCGSPTWRVHPASIKLAFAPKNLKVSSPLGPVAVESSSPFNSSQVLVEPDPAEVEADPVKLAFAKAKAYKKRAESKPTTEIARSPVDHSAGIDERNGDLKLDVSKSEALRSRGEDNGEVKVPLDLKLAFGKDKEYKKNKGGVDESEAVKGSEERSGMKVGNELSHQEALIRNNVDKKEQLMVSRLDFLGLEFSERKKSKGLPAGLVPAVDSFPEGDLPEVEILVGDASMFGDEAVTSNSIPKEELDIYKPKVSTWGVFPRPGNISKAYGGGRVIRPGEVLETAEDRAAKEAHTRQLLSAYKSKIGLNVNPKLKSECEEVSANCIVQALKDGNSFMDLGKLKEALPFYEKIMNKLAFQTELYGLAALQWSICQDSLSRRNEARVMYEKLQSHPNPQVSKRARQLIFGFQAMNMMKVGSSTISPIDTVYRNYFDAFVRDNSNYPIAEAEVNDAALRQALPYVTLLLAPILFVIVIAVLR